MTGAVRSALVAAALLALAPACSAPADLVDNLSVEYQLDPALPVAGEATVANLTLSQPAGTPVPDASISLEGHMVHPGMAPVIAPLESLGGGQYRATMVLTMAGDWQLVVTGRLADGRFVRQRVADIVAATKE